MAQKRARRTCAIFALVYALCVATATLSSQDRTEQEQARSWVESIAATAYGFAWPTATFKTWALKGIERVPGGLDINVRLSGTSAFDNGDLWVDLLFELRSGQLQLPPKVKAHNAILAEPFSTSAALAKLGALAVTEYGRQSRTPEVLPPPAPAPSAPPSSPPSAAPGRSGPVMALRVMNPTSNTLTYAYRWGEGAWMTETLESKIEHWHSYPIGSPSDTAPTFSIAFDNSLRGGISETQHRLTAVPATLPLNDQPLLSYAFVLTNEAVSIVPLRGQGLMEQVGTRFSLGITADDTGTFVHNGAKYDYGVTVRTVHSGGAGALGGFRPGDVICMVEDQPVFGLAGLRDLIAASQGGAMLVRVLREGRLIDLRVQPAFIR